MGGGGSYLSKMVTCINMIIFGAENFSPDMILTAFDRKFHEKKDELPPRACRPPKQLKKNNGKKWALQKSKKNNG